MQKKFRDLGAVEKITSVIIWSIMGVMAAGFLAGGIAGLNDIYLHGLHSSRSPAQTVVRDNNRYICSVKTQCGIYAETRQACATAGNFDNCMSIKMDDSQAYARMCTADGNIVPFTFSQPIPSAFECLLAKVGLD